MLPASPGQDLVLQELVFTATADLIPAVLEIWLHV